MADLKHTVEKMMRTKERLEDEIASLTESLELPIATNQHSWGPRGDDIWAFKIRRVGQIKVPEFISSFCDNQYFADYNESNDDLIICPIGLYDDTKPGELRDVSNQALKGLEKLFKDEKWWDEDYLVSNMNKNLEKVAKTIYRGCYEKGDLKGSIIFRASGSFSTIAEIEKFLHSLKILDFDVLVNTVHFGVLGERVTVFEYD